MTWYNTASDASQPVFVETSGVWDAESCTNSRVIGGQSVTGLRTAGFGGGENGYGRVSSDYRAEIIHICPQGAEHQVLLACLAT